MPRPDDVGVGTAVLILDENHRILLGKRKGAHRAGYWSCPGGWVDRSDQDIFKAVAREASEEANIELHKAEQLCWVTEDHPELEIRTITLYYLSWPKEWGGVPEVMEPDKCEEWRWFHLDELPSPLFPKLLDALEPLKEKLDVLGWLTGPDDDF